MSPSTPRATRATASSSWCRREDAERERGVAGGATRSESVRAGLAAVPDEATIICVHDAARPLATPELFGAVVDAVRAGADGAVPGGRR